MLFIVNGIFTAAGWFVAGVVGKEAVDRADEIAKLKEEIENLKKGEPE